MDKLKATITPKNSLKATIIPRKVLRARITIAKYISAPTYSGPYEVIPKPVDQILNTSNKLLVDNINVKSIPYSEVTNPQGGKTVTIGG
jgi:hypothetical protein